MNANKLRSLDDLKQNFNIDELIYCLYSGELEIWLRKIDEDLIADKLGNIKRNAFLLIELYNIFDWELEMTDSQNNNI